MTQWWACVTKTWQLELCASGFAFKKGSVGAGLAWVLPIHSHLLPFELCTGFVLGLLVGFADERKNALTETTTPELLSERCWAPSDSFCLRTDNEVSGGALNHLMLKGIPRRLHQSLCKIVRDLQQLINLIWGLFCWHLHKPSENYSYCIPIQCLNSELKRPFPSPLGGEINLCHRIWMSAVSLCRLLHYYLRRYSVWQNHLFRSKYFMEQ